METELKALERVVCMAFDHELARLRKLSAIVDARRAGITRLARARAARARKIEAGKKSIDFAFRVGQDAKWQEWCNEERVRLARELAIAMADYEAQRVVAKHAFGRLEAMSELSSKDDAARADVALRRTAAENLI